MNLPIEPTTMPAVRKYTRTFEADRTKVYREGDQIKIQIPPIANTYLTKNSKLYFDFDLTYNMFTQDDLDAIAANFSDSAPAVAGSESAVFYFGKKITYINNTTVDSSEATPGRMITKPFPTFDINGAYGLFNRIQVHDYLGTTLLEDIERHDLLTAIFADFDLTTEDIEVLRPTAVQLTDKVGSQNVHKAKCALPFNGYTEFTDFLAEDLPVRVTVEPGSTPIETITATTTRASIPTYHACINLYSFLGKLSNNFVPLHNGFTITLFVNNIDIPISYCNACSPNDNYSFITFPTTSLPLNPSTVSHSITNIRYKCDLLELSSELDSSVDKQLLIKSYKYQLDMKNENCYNITKRILPSVKSIRKLMISQRKKYTNTPNIYRELSFRVKNGVNASSLLYNKATICSSEGTFEHYETCKNMFGKTINNFYDISYFEDYAGDKSFQNLMLYDYLTFVTIDLNVELEDTLRRPDVYKDTKSNGKFIIAFDTRIPGTSESSISGIDASNNNLEYNVVYDADDTYPCFLDVFMEHDAVIHVDPGKSTSISF